MMPLPTDDEVFAEVCRARKARSQPRYVSEPAAKEVMAAVRTLIAQAAQHAESGALAKAIARAAIKRGIINEGTALTGPQLVMLCDDLATVPALAAQSQGAPTHCDPAEGFCAACREQERAAKAEAPALVGNLNDIPRYGMTMTEDGNFFGKLEAGPYWAVRDVESVLRAQQAAAPGALELLQYFVRAAYKVDTDINSRGHNWSAAYLDQALAAYHANSSAPSAPGTPEAPKPPFPINDSEMAALRRFWECATDGEGYDVEKAMMQRLAEMGVVQRKSGAYYMTTEFGLYVLGEYTVERAAQLDGGQGEGEKA